MRIKIGKTLRGIRKLTGKKQHEIAALIFVSRATYSAWENDKGCPSLIQIYAFTNAVNIPIQSFILKLEEDQEI
ncbi:helix-turn-helix transcriptional regulator [Pedobacter flavus]|uniref:Helix-turn-helix transcriptional regulator n=1 Tax=Pedobacter flavus TaxID=3113906 RepID=A0ABU7GZF8_9SPHI|nr:helix-turn-helix transcriptional regulator [Pedobacter sp. VNH31]MEE1884412.1 helix-turn-helix transcriptional regulator [Pedobacter sp. VNH31]